MSTAFASSSSVLARPIGKAATSFASAAFHWTLRISNFIHMRAEEAALRHQLATLDLRLLDDIGVTRAERDAIVLR